MLFILHLTLGGTTQPIILNGFLCMTMIINIKNDIFKRQMHPFFCGTTVALNCNRRGARWKPFNILFCVINSNNCKMKFVKWSFFLYFERRKDYSVFCLEFVKFIKRANKRECQKFPPNASIHSLSLIGLFFSVQYICGSVPHSAHCSSKVCSYRFFPFLRRAWFSNQGPLPNRSINIDYKILRL